MNRLENVICAPHTTPKFVNAFCMASRKSFAATSVARRTVHFLVCVCQHEEWNRDGRVTGRRAKGLGENDKMYFRRSDDACNVAGNSGRLGVLGREGTPVTGARHLCTWWCCSTRCPGTGLAVCSRSRRQAACRADRAAPQSRADRPGSCPNSRTWCCTPRAGSAAACPAGTRPGCASSRPRQPCQGTGSSLAWRSPTWARRTTTRPTWPSTCCQRATRAPSTEWAAGPRTCARTPGCRPRPGRTRSPRSYTPGPPSPKCFGRPGRDVWSTDASVKQTTDRFFKKL